MIGLVDGNNFYVSCERVFDRRLLGRPVAVLSNNDGCCVAMSPEFKALGIPRGTPYFQLKDRERSGELVFRSSNYELYGDMSRRVMSVLREEALEVEQYSIDEAFIHPPKPKAMVSYEAYKDFLLEYGARVREKVLRWTGIPCGVGFAPTKTLAKIANHIGKKLPDGVFVMPEDTSATLAKLPTSEVWGVGRRLPVKLKAERIFTAKDLRDARDEVLRAIGGITLVRTATELRGIACCEDRAYDADPESVSCSRSFGEPVRDLSALNESLASFAAEAAVKLRRHHLLAAGCNVYAQRATDGEFVGGTAVFDEPTDATNVMLEVIRPEVESLFEPGMRYRKSGVIFFGLERVGSAHQLDLFSEPTVRDASPLYRAIDTLNERLGKGAVFAAAEGLKDKRRWAMKRSMLSARATTNWRELMSVR